ncbi:pyrroloquinoline quinone biosynthesis peptide chaperone PqqD [Roseixanthobacter glucoisosaccharinicivorans]|uniref:pyrroloquinoline quinone biosynthesis peptide chaperone PqqD n=1 Tax=Roseixanthobacter glucoisosaccharinicivorans TaxID=3119923 RepID=UPI00372AECE6
MNMSFAPEARPRLPRGVRLRKDAHRGWLLLAPETVFAANGSAAEILELCDGARTFAELVDVLASRHGAERARIMCEAGRLLGALHHKRLLDL